MSIKIFIISAFLSDSIRRAANPSSILTTFFPRLQNAIPYHTPYTYKISPTLSIDITLLPANHCPGSTMFLIETSPSSDASESHQAVLHTGDVRADEPFITSLGRCEGLGRYLASWAGVEVGIEVGEEKEVVKMGEEMDLDMRGSGIESGRTVLDRIYLDTSAQLGTGDTPTRVSITLQISFLSRLLRF